MLSRIASQKKTCRPVGVDMMEVKTVVELDDLFKDCSKLIIVPFPAGLPVRVGRFDIVNDTFLFQVTEEFVNFCEFLQEHLEPGLPCHGHIRVVGAVGCGKSHLLAAMYAYFAYRHTLATTPGEDKSTFTIFIPSVKVFLAHPQPLKMFKTMMLGAFLAADAQADIAEINSWNDVSDFLAARDKVGIILDDANSLYVGESTEVKRALLGLYSIVVNVIEGLSARSEANSPSVSNTGWDVYDVNTGLRKQGAAWGSWVASFFPGASADDIGLLWAATEGIPLYLKTICMNTLPTLSARIEHFMHRPTIDNHTLFRAIGDQLMIDLAHNISTGSDQGFVNALARVSVGAAGTFADFTYDARFFYVDRDNRFHAVNGIVQTVTARLLWTHSEKFVSKALATLNAVKWNEVRNSDSTNSSLKDYAFLMYALSRIAANVGHLDREHDYPMQVISFDGDYPDRNTVDGATAPATLFWPRKFNLQHVNGVVKLVRSSKHIMIYGIQATTKTATELKECMNFFKAFCREESAATARDQEESSGGIRDSLKSFCKRLRDVTASSSSASKRALTVRPLTLQEMDISNILRYSPPDPDRIVECFMVWVHPEECEGAPGYAPLFNIDDALFEKVDQMILFL